MKIKIKLFATLGSYLPPGSSGGETLIDLPDAATVADALGVLDVPLTLAHIVFVNGRHVLRPNLMTHPLRAGDTLGVFPAIGGG